MAEFRMPSLGADMDAGTLIRWRRQPGDRVVRGDIIAEVETDKGIVEVEVYASGVIRQQLVPLGTKVPIGTPLATIDDETATPVSPMASIEQAPATAAPSPTPRSPEPLPSPMTPPAAHPSTPSARKLARELDVDIDSLRGSGRHGAVTRADVASSTLERPRLRVSPFARVRARELGVDPGKAVPTGPSGSVVAADVVRAAAAETGMAPRPAAATDVASRMRHAIGASMSRSKREIPHYYASHTIDLGAAIGWLRAANEGRSIESRLLPAVLLLRSVVVAVQKFSDFNGHWNGSAAVQSSAVHLGVAVSLRGGGLVAPAIMHAEEMDLSALMAAFKDVVGRARAGRLRAAEMSSATITVTSLGERGVDEVFPVIIPPQVAMVGFGTIQDRAVVDHGAVVARPTVVATLAADHRVTDGHRGGLFLAAIANNLMTPERL